MIIGGQAVIYYGYARLTGDIDFYYRRSNENAKKLFNALEEFWNGDIPGVDNVEELLEEGVIFQFGRPPNRIDLINDLQEVSFENAWQSREIVEMKFEDETVAIYYIGLSDLIQNKENAKRPKDFEDLKFLHRVQGKGR